MLSELALDGDALAADKLWLNSPIFYILHLESLHTSVLGLATAAGAISITMPYVLIPPVRFLHLKPFEDAIFS